MKEWQPEWLGQCLRDSFFFFFFFWIMEDIIIRKVKGGDERLYNLDIGGCGNMHALEVYEIFLMACLANYPFSTYLQILYAWIESTLQFNNAIVEERFSLSTLYIYWINVISL